MPSRERRALRVAKGQCPYCGRRESDGKECDPCRLKNNANRKARRRTIKGRLAEKVRSRRANVALRIETLEAYGGCRCACCGETLVEFLEIDHINNNGGSHRREINKVGGGKFYRWLRANGYPDGYQVLCSNCNLAKFRSGECPHERLRRESKEKARSER
jgi:hypothetical protein